MRHPSRLAALLAALLASTALGACGGDEEEEEARRQAVEETVIGYGESEGAEFCDFLSASALDQLGGESGCTQEYGEEVEAAELEVEEVILDGNEATVRVDNLDEGGDTFELELVDEDGEWKVSTFPGLEPIAPEEAPELPPAPGELPPPPGGGEPLPEMEPAP